MVIWLGDYIKDFLEENSEFPHSLKRKVHMKEKRVEGKTIIPW